MIIWSVIRSPLALSFVRSIIGSACRPSYISCPLIESKGPSAPQIWGVKCLACRKFPCFGPFYRRELALHCTWVTKSGPKVRTWERVSVFNMFFFSGASEQIEFPRLFNPVSHESHLVTGFKQLTEPDSYHLSISVHQHLGHQMLMTL